MPVEVQKHIGVSTTGGDLLPGETRESVDAINKGLGSILTSGTGLLVNAVSIDAMSDEDATMAGKMSDTELAEASAATLTDTPLAYSDQTGTIPVIDYEPGRARWWPVAALVAVILAVTGGAAGVILWLGHDPGQSHAPTEAVAEVAPTVTPGPLNGMYRVDTYDSQRVVRHTDGTVAGGSPQNNKVETGWWAIRSTCDRDVCTASSVSVHGDLHDQLEPFPPMALTLVNGQWRNDVPDVVKVPCAGGIPGEDTWEVSYTMIQLPDGTLKGEQINKIITNECQSAGTVITIPMSETRTGDIPSAVKWNE